jgi:hypothetical protein
VLLRAMLLDEPAEKRSRFLTFLRLRSVLTASLLSLGDFAMIMVKW